MSVVQATIFRAHEPIVARGDAAVKVDRESVPGLVLGAGVFLARTPFLFTGYGADSDA